MKNITFILFCLSILSLAGCSSNKSMKMGKLSPAGIEVSNIIQGQRAKAYRAAEKHCAKYYKVPRLLHSRSKLHDSKELASTMVFECVRAR